MKEKIIAFPQLTFDCSTKCRSAANKQPGESHMTDEKVYAVISINA